MKEVPTPTFPFSLINLPMGALPRAAPHDQTLVASIKAYWQQLTHPVARQNTPSADPLR